MAFELEGTPLPVEENSETTQNLMLFPNPTSQKLTIISSEKLVSARIMNELGQSIFSTSLDNSLRVSIDVEQLPSGFYVLELITEYNSLNHRKFIKQ